MSTARFCRLIDMPERDLAQVASQRAKQAEPPKGTVAPTGSYGCAGSYGWACVGQAGLGASQDLGDAPT